MVLPTQTLRCALTAALFCVSTAVAAIDYIGTYNLWPDQQVGLEWEALNGLNDPDDGVAPELDFVGDGSDPGGYWARDDNYLYLRMRVDVTAATTNTFRDSHLILIDVVGFTINTTTGLLESGDTPGTPDYGFAWDSKSNDPTAHGLEMQILDTSGPTWKDTKMDDIDGDNGKKLINDINGDGRTTDGYVRGTGGQTTTNFGDTTLIDFAVSWAYLSAYTSLTDQQTWNIAFGSISNATDHNVISADVAGGTTPSNSTSTGWVQLDPSGGEPVPVPSTLALALLGLAGFWPRSRPAL